MYPVYLESRRIALRELLSDDVSSLEQIFRDLRAIGVGHVSPESAAANLPTLISASAAPKRTDFGLAAVLLNTGEMIGMANLTVDSLDHRTGTIGGGLVPPYWGQGLATEATGLLLVLGFELLGLHRITATCDPQNRGVARVLEKNGMRLEGHLHQDHRAGDSWRDSFLYGIVEDEWAGRIAPGSLGASGVMPS
jgi:ribosomal-protein-alanine N-acetyltransferase